MRAAWHLLILLVALLCGESQLAAAQAGKGGTPHRGGNAPSHMSSKGLENSNAQWSADPERGWVRAEDRHQLKSGRHPTKASKENRGQHKGKGPHGKEASKTKD
jgi:hypothetical protein